MSAYLAVLLPFAWIAAWIAAWIGASIVYRRRSGKPVFPRAPEGAVFVEACRSGRSLANALTRLGGDSNCPLIYVADRALTITPVFPFNLMFLPEIYGLVVAAPLADVTVEGVKDGLLGKRIILAIRGPRPRRFELWLKDRDAFRAALEGGRADRTMAGAGEAPRRPRGGWRSIGFRLFALVWGLGALYGGATGVQEDRRFRSQGVAVIGRITGHTGDVGTRGDSGVVSYRVAGATYEMVSMRGSGIYRVGDTDRLHYLPTDPGQAREDDVLGFDLLFAFLGVVILTLAATFGWIARAFAQAMNVVCDESRASF